MMPAIPPGPDDDRIQRNGTPKVSSHTSELQWFHDRAWDLYKRGATPDQIEADLMAKGLDQRSAFALVKDIVQASAQPGRMHPVAATGGGSGAGSGLMVGGCLLSLVGLAITALTVAGGRGGFIMTGLIVGGIIMFFRGMSQSRQ